MECVASRFSIVFSKFIILIRTSIYIDSIKTCSPCLVCYQCFDYSLWWVCAKSQFVAATDNKCLCGCVDICRSVVFLPLRSALPGEIVLNCFCSHDTTSSWWDTEASATITIIVSIPVQQRVRKLVQIDRSSGKFCHPNSLLSGKINWFVYVFSFTTTFRCLIREYFGVVNRERGYNVPPKIQQSTHLQRFSDSLTGLGEALMYLLCGVICDPPSLACLAFYKFYSQWTCGRNRLWLFPYKNNCRIVVIYCELWGKGRKGELSYLIWGSRSRMSGRLCNTNGFVVNMLRVGEVKRKN